MSYVFQRDYARYYETLNQGKQYKKEIEFVWKWARRPLKILDLGCGTAHYWKYWPDQCRIYGIEKSKPMIAMSPYKRRIKVGEISPKEFDGLPKYDLVTALFDVVGYLPQNDWWKSLPLKEKGYFVFDFWDKQKVLRDGFKTTIRVVNDIVRVITPIYQDENRVKLRIDLTSTTVCLTEMHEMFLYDIGDMAEFAGDDFDIADIKRTEKWQTWIKLKKR